MVSVLAQIAILGPIHFYDWIGLTVEMFSLQAFEQEPIFILIVVHLSIVLNAYQDSDCVKTWECRTLSLSKGAKFKKSGFDKLSRR